MSRQNYYARRRQREGEQVDGDLIEQMVVRERRMQPRVGGRKLHRTLSKELAEAGVEVGRDRFFGVLRQRKLLLEPKPALFAHTTQSRHYLPVFTNQIKDLELSAANQVWISDITYIRTREGFLYLALISDKWSRKVVAITVGRAWRWRAALRRWRWRSRSCRSRRDPFITPTGARSIVVMSMWGGWRPGNWA